MLRPSLEQFESLSQRGNLIPVAREILADLDTPLSLFRRLDDGRTSFLLESVEGGEKWARYSFLGTGARATFSARGQEVTWTERVDGEWLAIPENRPLELERYRAHDIDLVVGRFSRGTSQRVGSPERPTPSGCGLPTPVQARGDHARIVLRPRIK